MQFFIVLAGLVAGVISGTIFEDYLTSTMPSLTADTVCPGIKHVKGTVSRDLLLQGFHGLSSPKAPENSIRIISNFFSKIRRDISKSRCTTSIYDTGVNVTGGK
jgi:hypothetical protein